MAKFSCQPRGKSGLRLNTNYNSHQRQNNYNFGYRPDKDSNKDKIIIDQNKQRKYRKNKRQTMDKQNYAISNKDVEIPHKAEKYFSPSWCSCNNAITIKTEHKEIIQIINNKNNKFKINSKLIRKLTDQMIYPCCKCQINIPHDAQFYICNNPYTCAHLDGSFLCLVCAASKVYKK